MLGSLTCRMLSVWQPWADFLTADETVVAYIRKFNAELATRLPKDVENRGYGTTWQGLLFVHAAQRVDRNAMEWFGLDPARFVRGAVVGVVRLDRIVSDSASSWAEHGRRHWVVTDPVRLDDPVPCRGFQGIRTPPPPVASAVLTRLDRQRELGR